MNAATETINGLKILNESFTNRLVNSKLLYNGYSKKIRLKNPYVSGQGLELKIFIFSNFSEFRSYCEILNFAAGNGNAEAIARWQNREVESLSEAFFLNNTPYFQNMAEKNDDDEFNLRNGFYWVNVDLANFGEWQNGEGDELWLISKEDNSVWARDLATEAEEDAGNPIWVNLGSLDFANPNFIEKLQKAYFSSSPANSEDGEDGDDEDY